MQWRRNGWLAVIVLVAAIVRFWGLAFGLPHTFARPDETIIIDVALAFLRGNFRPAFFDYPWLYMWSLAGLYLLYYVWGRTTGIFHSLADLVASWRVNWVPFFLLPRAMSAAFGIATVLVAFRIARRLWNDTTGLVAALFLALAFLHVRDSHFGTTDVMMTCLLVLSVSILLDAHLSKRRHVFVVAGLVGGLAAATKYNALLLVAPVTASYLVNVVEASDRRKAWLDPRLFLYGLPFLATFAIGVPFLLVDLPKFIDGMQLLRQSMESGSNGLDLGAGWLHHLEYSLRYGLGLPLLVAGLLGMAVVILREPRIGILLFSFPIVYFIVAGSISNLFFRYAIPLVPFLCLAAARLVTRFVRSEALVAVAAVLLVLPSAISTLQFDRIISRTDNRVVVARWFDEHVPAGSSVLLSGSSYGYVQFNRDKGYQAWLWDRKGQVFVIEPGKRPATGRPEWILLQESPLPSETQDIVTDYLTEGYSVAQAFPAFSPSDAHVYDLQDAFFAPFAGFRGVERPGPNYLLYRRNSSAP
jgi:4-amino-4-deoxy-L-arabinose transferase-like glycosyltransferase